MIGKFGPYTIFYKTFLLASVATYGFLELASVAAYEFLGISCQKPLFSLHFAFLCIDASMEYQHSCIPILHNLEF